MTPTPAAKAHLGTSWDSDAAAADAALNTADGPMVTVAGNAQINLTELSRGICSTAAELMDADEEERHIAAKAAEILAKEAAEEAKDAGTEKEDGRLTFSERVAMALPPEASQRKFAVVADKYLRKKLPARR